VHLVVWAFISFPGRIGNRRRDLLWYNLRLFPEEIWVESSSRFVPGAIAPRSGVYRVHHYAHRMPHLVTVIKGMTFPECQRCGDKVRFVPMMAAEPIETDVDFAERDFVA
jgi:hypothetical protein